MNDSAQSSSRRIRCDFLDTTISLPTTPRRVAVLASGFTEACWAMGLADRVAAVSSYCRRYVDVGARPVAGNYLRVNETVLRDTGADLIVMTNGAQLGVARRLLAAGLPVFVLPVPDSFAGILENIRRLGALLNAMPQAHALVARMENEAAALRASAPAQRPRVYTELWFGRYPRTIGGLTFIHDLVSLAGGENLGAAQPGAYLRLNLPAVAAARPEKVLVFWEEDDTPVAVPELLRERGWPGQWDFQTIEAGIARGQNLIHDGPSFLETARWLRGKLFSENT